MAARSLLEATRPIDEGDDGFTSGCPANTAGLAPRHGISPSRPLGVGSPFGPSLPNASISISIASRVDAAGSRRKEEEVGLPRRVRERAKRARSMARGHRIIHTAGLHRESIASVLLPSNLESPWGWVSLPFPSEDSIP